MPRSSQCLLFIRVETSVGGLNIPVKGVLLQFHVPSQIMSHPGHCHCKVTPGCGCLLLQATEGIFSKDSGFVPCMMTPASVLAAAQCNL